MGLCVEGRMEGGDGEGKVACDGEGIAQGINRGSRHSLLTMSASNVFLVWLGRTRLHVPTKHPNRSILHQPNNRSRVNCLDIYLYSSIKTS